MAKIAASISILDIAPARDLFKICADMVEDDRVPPEYRVRIADTLRPYVTGNGDDRPVVVELPTDE